MFRNRDQDKATEFTGQENWTAIFRLLLPGLVHLPGFRIPSVALLVAAVVLGLLTLAFHTYVNKREARFVRERTLVYGTVLNAGFLLPRTRRGEDPPTICYVRYRFIPAGGSALTAWRIGSDACWLEAGAVIPVDYVPGSPELNRPRGYTSKSFLLLTPMWILTVVLIVWGVLQRRAEGPLVGSHGYEVPGVVESIKEGPIGCFVLTYTYEAGRGRQYGQCEISDTMARKLKPGATGSVMVDPMQPSRSDWLGPSTAK